MIEFFIIHQEPVNYTVEEQLYMSAYKMMEQHGQPASDILTELDNRRQEIRQLPAQTEDVLVLKENLGKTASIRNSIVRGSVYAVY